jgi:hypothetical protein
VADKIDYSNPVRPEHREAFQRYLKKWQSALGLTDWRLVVSPKPTKNMADVQIQHDARLARLRFGSDFGATPINEEALESTALHELLHVVLCELRHSVTYGITDEDVLNSSEHRVINMLTALLLSKPGGK